MAQSTPQYLLDPYRVIHIESKSTVQGFKDMASAEADAKDRNIRSKNMGLSCTYSATKKPD